MDTQKPKRTIMRPGKAWHKLGTPQYPGQFSVVISSYATSLEYNNNYLVNFPTITPPSIQCSTEKKERPLQPQPNGGSYSKPVLSETAQFDDNTKTHTHKQQS